MGFVYTHYPWILSDAYLWTITTTYQTSETPRVPYPTELRVLVQSARIRKPQEERLVYPILIGLWFRVGLSRGLKIAVKRPRRVYSHLRIPISCSGACDRTPRSPGYTTFFPFILSHRSISSFSPAIRSDQRAGMQGWDFVVPRRERVTETRKSNRCSLLPSTQYPIISQARHYDNQAHDAGPHVFNISVHPFINHRCCLADACGQFRQSTQKGEDWSCLLASNGAT